MTDKKKTEETTRSTHELLQSLFRPEMKVNYVPEEKRLLQEIIDGKTLKGQDLKDAKTRIADIPDIPFLIIKLPDHAQQEVADKGRKFYLSRLRQLREEMKDVTAAELDKAITGVEEEQAREMIADNLLAIEGKSEEWAEEVDDSEVNILPEEESAFHDTDTMTEDERLAPSETAEKRREDLTELRKATIREERKEERDKRKAELQQVPLDELQRRLINANINMAAMFEGMSYQEDEALVWAVRDPKNREKVFQNIDALRSFFDDDLKSFLREKYNALQLVKTKLDVDRVAKSGPF